MNSKALNTLEYNKIIERLVTFANSEMAKKSLSILKPMTNIGEIREALSETTEGVTVLVRKGSAPLGQIYDIEGALVFSRKGGTLNPKQLLQVLHNLKVASDVIGFLKTDLPELKIIDGIREVITTFPKLVSEIDRCILSEDEIADNASPELRSIRRAIANKNDQIKNRLNNILNSQENRTYLQDSIVTVRDGRYVIPVKQEYRSKFPGIIHDQSQTGATLFIEPQAIVNFNNELRELELKEEVEIARILAELSSRVAEHYYDISNNQKLLTELDRIFAKAKLSQELMGEEPKIIDRGELVLKEARHPLIDSKKVVPINVSCGGDYTTLVITGPNTGGKTVTLKTVGLLVIMALSGLHIPASSESIIPLFSEVYADIGDEQSIEQSLSTFSSHMKNLVSILKKADCESLVLLDELGAGTDPTEGAALAISILEELKRWNSVTIATTHYNELKKYALSKEGVENGSMEFDINTLSPTYRLFIGIPGKSNAFEISRKLGLKEELIERANELLEKGDIEFEDVLDTIERDKKQAAKELAEANLIIAKAREEEEEMNKRMEALKEKERVTLAKAKEEARDIIKEAKDTAKDVSKELKALSKIESLGERTRKFDESRKKLKSAEDKFNDTIVKRVNQKPVKASELKLGDKVKVLTLDQVGEIIGLPDKNGDLVVQMGFLKANINIEDLMLMEDSENKPKARATYSGIGMSKAKNTSISVNVQGENLEDALVIVDKYLDDAYIGGLKTVTIIHGRGEGILKSGIRQNLKRHKMVKSFRKGGFDEGGDGVTVVTFKD